MLERLISPRNLPPSVKAASLILGMAFGCDLAITSAEAISDYPSTLDPSISNPASWIVDPALNGLGALSGNNKISSTIYSSPTVYPGPLCVEIPLKKAMVWENSGENTSGHIVTFKQPIKAWACRPNKYVPLP